MPRLFQGIQENTFSNDLFIKNKFAAKTLVKFSFGSPLISTAYCDKIFNLIENPDASIHNIMLIEYVRRNCHGRAIHFYKLMLNSNMGPNVYTYPFLVHACAIRLSLFEGKQMHNHVLKLGFGSDVHVRSILIDMYAACEEDTCAFKVFDEGPMMASFAFHPLLKGLTLCGYSEDAEHVYNLMPEKDAIATGIIIRILYQAGRREKADQLVEEIPENDTDSWIAIFDSLREHGMVEEIAALFIRLQGNRGAIHKCVVKVVLKACTLWTRFDGLTVKLIHCLVVKNELEPEFRAELISLYNECESFKL